jgi:hypothetical protein
MKNFPVGDELFRVNRQAGGWTDGQTYMTKLVVDFCNFANSPINKKAVSVGHNQTAVSFHR